MMKRTRKLRLNARRKNIARAFTKSFRYVTGTSGSMTRSHISLFRKSQPGAKAKDLLAGSKLVNERGFAGRVTDSGDELDRVWTPDGRRNRFRCHD